MDTNIYYIPQHKGVLVTSDFSEIQKRMDIGIDPRIEYVKISESDLKDYPFSGVGFKNVDKEYFQGIKELFAKYKFEVMSFYDSSADLSDFVFDVEHLVIGDNAEINLSVSNFKNLRELSFLSLKTFKGKILSEFTSVEEVVVWYDINNINSIVNYFPCVKRLTITDSTIEELDLNKLEDLRELEVRLCRKLKHVKYRFFHKLEKFWVRKSKQFLVNDDIKDIVKIIDF